MSLYTTNIIDGLHRMAESFFDITHNSGWLPSEFAMSPIPSTAASIGGLNTISPFLGDTNHNALKVDGERLSGCLRSKPRGNAFKYIISGHVCGYDTSYSLMCESGIEEAG